MNVNLKSKNLEISESIREYVATKISDLERFIPAVEDDPVKSGSHHPVVMDVEVGKTTKHQRKGDVFRAEINISVPGMKHVLRSESIQQELHLAIDEAKDDMQRQLKKYREKRTDEVTRDRRKLKDKLRLSRFARRKNEK